MADGREVGPEALLAERLILREGMGTAYIPTYTERSKPTIGETPRAAAAEERDRRRRERDPEDYLLSGPAYSGSSQLP